MPQSDDHSDKQRIDTQDAAIWRHSCLTEAGDEAERFLDLAGFADARLDSDDAERVAAWLAADPDAAADAAAAKALAAAPPVIAAEVIVARAGALVRPAASFAAAAEAAPGGEVVPLVLYARPASTLFQRAARWGSLAAAIMVASWLGFTLGSGASLDLGRTAQVGDDGFVGDLLNPATGVLRNLTDGLET